MEAMNQPLVSIVVPVYQVEAYLDQCVASLVGQSYSHLQIILVNDGSKDSSGAMCEAWAEKDARIAVIHQENQGLSGARNTGMAAASGRFLVFMDSDDWLALDIIEKAVNLAMRTGEKDELGEVGDADKKKPLDLVLWRYKKVTENSESAGANFLAAPQWTAGFAAVQGITPISGVCDGWLFEDGAVQTQLFRKVLGPLGMELNNPMLLDSNTSSWAKLYNRELLVQNQLQFMPTQEIGSEDLPFTLQVLHLAKSVAWMNEFGLMYRKDNAGSLTKNHGNTLFKRYVKLNQFLDEFYQQHVAAVDENGAYRRALNNRQALNILNVCLSLMYRGYQVSAWEKYKQLNRIFGDTDYRKRLKKLELGNLSLGFRAFYGSARLGFTPMGFVLLKLMLWVNRRSN